MGQLLPLTSQLVPGWPVLRWICAATWWWSGAGGSAGNGVPAPLGMSCRPGCSLLKGAWPGHLPQL